MPAPGNSRPQAARGGAEAAQRGVIGDVSRGISTPTVRRFEIDLIRRALDQPAAISRARNSGTNPMTLNSKITYNINLRT
jgi:hypothetical protein